MGVELYKERKEMLQKLPPSLLNEDWFFLLKTSTNKWYLETPRFSKEEADAFKERIPYPWIPRYLPFYNKWQFKALLKLKDIEVELCVDGGSKPQNCQVIETKEWKEVSTFKSICEDPEDIKKDSKENDNG